MSRLNTVLQEALEAIDVEIAENQSAIFNLEMDRDDIAGLLKKRLGGSSLEPKEITPKPMPQKPKEEVTPKLETQNEPDDEDYIPPNQRSKTLSDYLIDQGAKDKWVKATLTDISKLLNLTAPAIMVAIEDLKQSSDIRVCRVMSGEYRGNNFTFNQDIEEPNEGKNFEHVQDGFVEVDKPKEASQSVKETETKADEPIPFEKLQKPAKIIPKPIPVAKATPQPDQKEPAKRQPVEPPFVDEIVGQIFEHYEKKRNPVFGYALKNLAKKAGCTERQAIDALLFIDNDKSINVTAKMAEYDKSDWIFHITEGA